MFISASTMAPGGPCSASTNRPASRRTSAPPRPRLSLRPRLRRHECDILPNQGLETLIISRVAGHQLSLFARHVASNGFAPFSALEAVVRPVGSLAHDAEFARFHACNLGDLL